MRRVVGMAATAAMTTVLLAVPASAVEKQQPKAKATVRQVASVVAEMQPGLLEDVVAAKSACVFSCTVIGSLKALTIQAKAGTLNVILTGIDNRSPKNRLYIGTIPKELRQLVATTKLSATDVDNATEAFQSCHSTRTTTCAAELTAMRSTWSRLESRLNGWSPYL